MLGQYNSIINGFHKNIELISSCLILLGLGTEMGKGGVAARVGVMDRGHPRDDIVLFPNTSGLISSSISGTCCE